MEIIFNELSFSHLALSRETANDWMNLFFEVIKSLSSRLHKAIYIRSTENFGGKFISNNYVFSEWLSKIKDRDVMRKIIASLIHFPLHPGYPYYNFNKLPCIGLGVAYEEGKLTCGYPVDSWDDHIKFTCEYFNDIAEVEEIKCSVRNVSSPHSVYVHFPKRLFQHHKEKHDNKRHNLNDGESTLLYDMPEKQEPVQVLLDCSFNESNDDEIGSRRYNFDENRNLYIEFNWHGALNYHGYHITDETRVPYNVKKKIKEFKSL